jgi:hypothetical protein
MADEEFKRLNHYSFVGFACAQGMIPLSGSPTIRTVYQSRARHQFRSAGAAERNCSVRRSAAERREMVASMSENMSDGSALAPWREGRMKKLTPEQRAEAAKKAAAARWGKKKPKGE